MVNHPSNTRKSLSRLPHQFTHHSEAFIVRSLKTTIAQGVQFLKCQRKGGDHFDPPLLLSRSTIDEFRLENRGFQGYSEGESILDPHHFSLASLSNNSSSRSIAGSAYSSSCAATNFASNSAILRFAAVKSAVSFTSARPRRSNSAA